MQEQIQENKPVQPVQLADEKSQMVKELNLLKVDSIKEVQFSKSDDTVLFLKKIENDGLRQELIVQNLSVDTTQTINIEYKSALEGIFIQKFEFINENLIYCLHMTFIEDDYSNGDVYLLRMDINKKNGVFTATYDIEEDTISSLGFLGTRV